MNMMMKFLLFLIGFGFLFTSCIEDDGIDQQEIDEQANLKDYLERNKIPEARKANGIYFLRADTISGAIPELTDYVLVNYKMKLLNSKLVETNDRKLAQANSIPASVNTSGPFYSKVSDLFLPGIRAGMLMMNEGDSAVFIIPNDMALGSYYTSLIPSYANIIYEVRLIKIIKDPIKYDRELINKAVTDSLKINLSDTDKTGNYIKILDAGKTDQPIAEGNNVLLRYKGRYVDGRYFGDLNKFDTITFQPGYGKLIEGFENAVLSMNNKGKAKMIIPYYNAYGINGKSENNGSISIPCYTSLYYEIEIISVK